MDPADAQTSPRQDTPATAAHTTREALSPNASNPTDRQSPNQTDRQSPKANNKFPNPEIPVNNKTGVPEVAPKPGSSVVGAKKPSSSESSKDPAPTVPDRHKPLVDDGTQQKDAGNNTRGSKPVDVSSKEQASKPVEKNKMIDNIRKDLLEGRSDAPGEGVKGGEKPEIATGRSVRSAKEGMFVLCCVCVYVYVLSEKPDIAMGRSVGNTKEVIVLLMYLSVCV